MKQTTEMRRLRKQARLIMSKYLNRELLPWEDVHHKDENVFNNEIDNLEVLTRKDHLEKHAGIILEIMPNRIMESCAGRYMVADDPNFSWCHNCKRFLPRLSFSLREASWNGLDPNCKECRKILRKKWKKWDGREYKREWIREWRKRQLNSAIAEGLTTAHKVGQEDNGEVD